MQAFTVYSIDYVKREKKPIGVVYERRTRNRPENFLGLLKVARKTYGLSPEYDFCVVLDKDALKGPGREA